MVDNDGKTALHHLLGNPGMPDDALLQFINREEVAPTLSTKDNAGYSPFHYALRILRPEVCELLLSKGANILEPDPAGFTVLHHVATQWSATSQQPSASRRLSIDLPASYFDSSLALWQRFLAARGTINAADKSGNTPLHIFMLSVETRDTPEDTDVCHVDYFDKLFPSKSGVNIFATNLEREIALHVMARRMYQTPEHEKRLFKAMMDRGLDPLDEDSQGRTPLDITSACRQDAILEMFGRSFNPIQQACLLYVPHNYNLLFHAWNLKDNLQDTAIIMFPSRLILQRPLIRLIPISTVMRNPPSIHIPLITRHRRLQRHIARALNRLP